MPRFLVILDVDSTLIEDEVIELLAAEAGSLPQVAAITDRAMNGELDFAESLRERAATLAGLPVQVFERVRAAVRVTAGVPQMIAAVHAAGGRVGVVSGGFAEIVGPLADELGLDYWRANRLEVADGALTGRTNGPIIDAKAKAVALAEWTADFNPDATVAVGDGANDLAMMAKADLSVGFDAKAPVRAAADIALPQRDLGQLLAVLGLRG
jgi:phosphoserine phosphatase